MLVLGFKQKIQPNLLSKIMNIWKRGYDKKRFLKELEVSSNFGQLFNVGVSVTNYDDWTGETTFMFSSPVEFKLIDRYFIKSNLIFE